MDEGCDDSQPHSSLKEEPMMNIRVPVLAIATTLLASINVSHAQEIPQAMPSVDVPAVTLPAITQAPVAMPSVSSYAAPTYAAPSYASTGGCAACGTSIPQGCHCGGAYMPSSAQKAGLFGGILGHASIGDGCTMSAGCSSYAQQRTFLWGGCNQFFNPGNNCGGGLFGCRNCITPPLGQGGIGSNNLCEYGSYNNR